MNCHKLLLWILAGMPFVSPAQPPDVIFVNGYEPGVTVAFTGDQSVLMTTAGQSHTFTVQVLNESGQPALDQEVEWHLSAGSGLILSNIQDWSVTVTVDAFAVGSAQLWAIHTGSGARATANVLQGSLQAGAHYIPSAWLLEGTSGTPEIRLIRNADTESFLAGDVIVSGDEAGILVRILSVNLEADRVRLTVEPARLTDAFAELSVDVQSAPTRLSVSLSDGPAAKAASDGLIQKSLSEDLECMSEGSTAIGFDLSGPSIDMNFEPTTEVILDISGGAVERFSLAAVADTGLHADTGELSFTTDLSGKVECTFQLPEIFSPPLPVSALSFQLNVAPVVGFEALATFSGPSFTISGPKLEVNGHARAGIDYQPALGWAPLAEIGYSGGLEPLSAEFDHSITFTLRGGPFVTGQMGLVANLGTPPLGIQLADLRFVEVKALGELEFEMQSPLNVKHKDYRGPRWDVDAIITGKYQAELADGALFLVLDALGVPTSIDALTGPIFDPITIPLAKSPSVSVQLDCASPCTLDPEIGESALMTITSDDEGTGLATFVATLDGGTIADELATAPYENGQAEATWAPGTADTGSYAIYPRLSTDTLSQFFPYAGTTGQTVTVGPGDTGDTFGSYSTSVALPGAFDYSDTCGVSQVQIDDPPGFNHLARADAQPGNVRALVDTRNAQYDGILGESRASNWVVFPSSSSSLDFVVELSAEITKGWVPDDHGNGSVEVHIIVRDAAAPDSAPTAKNEANKGGTLDLFGYRDYCFYGGSDLPDCEPEDNAGGGILAGFVGSALTIPVSFVGSGGDYSVLVEIYAKADSGYQVDFSATFPSFGAVCSP